MNKLTKTLTAVALLISVSACSGLSREQRHTAIGAAVGGVAGNMIGNSTGATLGGAALGGLIGSQIK